ncbi:uncharacterized protein LOC110695594 [Chenopodium quinoa]|nr:uncharacterized protein LOC110695594 [Chenopodium quinoa]
MIQTLNIPYSSKTDEIMSRYRPIAPKPETPANSTNTNGSTSSSYDAPLVPEKFRQSPYLRNMWSHLQARPTRTRKRGRGSAMSPAAAAALLRKQQEQEQQQQQQSNLGRRAATTTFMGLCSPTHLPSSARNLSIQAFGLYTDHQHNNNSKNNHNNVVELPLLSCPMLSLGNYSKAIDLNTAALETTTLEDRDLQLQLQVPSSGTNKTSVISPRPIRPVGSCISILGPISDNPGAWVIAKAPDEAEAEAEAEALPAVISDRSNKVRMVNSAYKELVGQPECPWLDTMCSGGRISGEVMLQLSESGLPVSSKGFSCWVKIEWESDGKKKSVNAYCDVVKMVCISKDYVLYWRFHTKEFSPSG